MKSSLIIAAAAAFAILCGAHSNLHGGGITLYEVSTTGVRLASAGWASRANDPSTVFTNPAGMSRICSPTLQAGPQAVYFHAPFKPNSDTNVIGKNGDGSRWLPSGSSFYVQPLSDTISVGAGALGYFGSDLNMGKQWVGRYYFTKVFLEGFTFVPAVSYKVTDCLSIGLGANVMYGMFDQHSAIRNALDGLPDGKMLLRHRYLTAGAIAGVLYDITPCTRIGVQYMSPVDLRFNMVPNFKGVGPLLTAALAATGVLKSKIKLKANVPQSVMVSLYHDLNCWSFMADAGWQQWSRFEKASISLNDVTSTTLTVVPKYRDSWHVAAGVEYHYGCDWTLSGGIAYDSSVVNSSNCPIDFPAGQQWRFGTGATWNYSENLKFDLTYEFMWTGDLTVDVNKGRLAGHVDGKYRNLSIQFISADLIWAF